MSDIGRERDPRPGNPFYRMAVLTLTALIVGGAASLAAVAFVNLVDWLNHGLLISPRTRVQYEETVWLVPLATVLVPAIGGLLVGLLITIVSPAKRPLGPPDVIQAVQFRTALPDPKSGIASTLAASISLGFGASVGQYGPMVYLGALFGSCAHKLGLRVPNLPAIAIACGVAAAVATAFNAPIAGLVFAHEVVLRHYSTQAFAPTTVAAATGYIIANVVFERPTLFLVEFAGVEHGYEFGLFALLGILAAGLAIGFMCLLLSVAKLANKSRLPAVLRPAAAGLALGVTALWLPDILGVGQEVLRFATIEGAFEQSELLILILAKIAMTALCIGFGFVGGVFSPALLIGVLLGAWFWTLITTTGLFATSGIAVYALCGMMAMTSPVIGAPLTTILIVFELTHNYDITIAAMVAVVFSNLVAHRLFGRSLFDVQLASKGIDLSEGRDHARLLAISALSVCSGDGDRDYLPAMELEPLADALKRLRDSGWQTAFVTDKYGLFLGLLHDTHQVFDSSEIVRDRLRPAELRFDEKTTVVQALRALHGKSHAAVPIVDSQTGQLRGTIAKAALIDAYLDVVDNLRSEENAAL